MADSTLIRIETDPDVPYPLGRSIVWHDPQNRLHRALPQQIKLLPDKNQAWFSPEQFDQKGSSCTMQSATKVAYSGPNRAAFKPYWSNWDTEAERHAGYLRAQGYDPYPGGEPDYDGSSTDAPYKLLREDGAIRGWKWLFGIDEVKQWVMYHGPLSVGTNWYNSMFRVDPKTGFIKVLPTGVVGGHAYAIVGYSVVRKAFRIHNSWGDAWGLNGRAWIAEADLARLLGEQGEAVTVSA